MVNILNKLKLDKNKILLIGIILIVIIGIPLTIMQSQKQQEIRQRASERLTSETVTESSVSLALVRKDTGDIEVGSKFAIEIRLINNRELDISALMTTINYDPALLQLSEFRPESKKPRSGGFDAIINSTLDPSPTPGAIQYAAVNSDFEQEIDDDDILIGTLTFQGIATGSADVTFGKTETQVTALGKEEALEVSHQDDEIYEIVPIPERSISVDLVVKIDGISSTPRTTVRIFTIRPVGGNDPALEENMEFDEDSKSFKKATHIPENLTRGNYTIQTKNSLRKFIGFIDPNQNIEIPQVTLALGDVNEDNKVDIADFNVISNCFGDKLNSDACKAHSVDLELGSADFDEDGEITGIDYNIFLRALAIREGD